MWLLRRCFPEKCAFVCLLMCTHGVQTLLPALWLPLLFPAWAAQAAWAGSPSERISDAAWTWRCAHLCSARHKPAGSERWMAGTSRCHPPLLTPLLPAEEEWVRTPPNFTCYTTFVFIACFCVCVCVFFALPAYRLTVIFILFLCLEVTQILYTQHPSNIQRGKST